MNDGLLQLEKPYFTMQNASFGMWKTAFYVVSVYNCYGGRLPASVGKYYGYSAGGLGAHYKSLGDVGRLRRA